MERLQTPKFTFIDLFAGIGGIRQGFEAAGGKCVYTCEINDAALQTYKANFGTDGSIGRDITKINEKDIPSHDVLCAGFPCQPFSIAGVSKRISLGMPHGFLCHTQGTLFFDVARIISYHKPKIVFLENVKNLLSHDKGNTYRVIEKTLRDLGYDVTYRVIDARYFVPQHRERIFIVANRIHADIDLNTLKLPVKTPTLAQILHNPQNSLPTDLAAGYTDVKGKPNRKYTLSDALWGYLQNYAARQKEKGNGFGYGLFGEKDVARTLSARYYKDGSEILIKQNGKNPRKLTPRECARLMGFPDTYKIVVSDTQAYKQFGNSVVVPVIKQLAKHIAGFL